MKLFSSSLLASVIAYYIMMMIVIIAVLFLNKPLLSIIGIPFYVIAILGVKFGKTKKNTVSSSTTEHSIKNTQASAKAS